LGKPGRGRIFRMRKILAAKMPRRGLQRGTLWHGDVTRCHRRLYTSSTCLRFWENCTKLH